MRGTKAHGRYANQVRVRSPQGSAYDGQRGVVVKPLGTSAVLVRLESGAQVPFGLGELEVLA